MPDPSTSAPAGDNWTSLNTRLVRSIILGGLGLVLTALVCVLTIYDRYLQREVTGQAESLVQYAENVSTLAKARQELEWHLDDLQNESADIVSIDIVDRATSQSWLHPGEAGVTDPSQFDAGVLEQGENFTFAMPFKPDRSAFIADDADLYFITTLSAGALKDQVWKDLTWLINVLVLGVAIIAILMYLLIRRQVLNPLHSISQALEQSDHSILDETSSRNDEIGDVATVLKRPLLQLRQSLNTLASVLNHVADGILTLDENGAVDTMNGAAESIFGYSEERLRGTPFVDLLIAHEGGLHSSAGGSRSECFIRHSSGEMTPVEVAINHFSNAGTSMFTAVIRDITDWKENQRQLIESRERAERATTAKSEFLATMSHEIRTPMNGVLGMAQLLLDSKLDDQQRESVQIVHSSAEALLSLLNDILDFSKIESGRIDFEAVSFDLKDSIRDVIDLLSGQASAKSLQVDLDFGPKVPMVLRGDQGRIRQVLMNLLGNAIKFTEQGRITIRVEDLGSTSEKCSLRVSVQDQGIGMNAATRARLFKPFTQADASMSRRFGGTGLGLAICKQLIEQMGGAIGVESAEGEGSTFFFTLNLPISHEIPEPSKRIRSDRETSYKGTRILLAEDNVVNQKVAVRMLAKMECTVDVAANGKEAIDMWREFPYDLVLMDCQMPELDGFEASRRIRSMEQTETRIPIIALTANAMDSDRQACIEAGMDAHLSKPVNYETLANAIGEWRPGNSS